MSDLIREQFEEWVQSYAKEINYSYQNILKRDGENYAVTWVDSAWIGWQASRAVEIEREPTIKHMRSVEEALICATDMVSELEQRLQQPVKLPKLTTLKACRIWSSGENGIDSYVAGWNACRNEIEKAGFKIKE